MSVTSPPPAITTVMEKNLRRVRFSLPEATLNIDKRPVHIHGTTMYVNGTLINVTSTIHSTTSETKAKNDCGAFKSSLKAGGGGGSIANGMPKESSQYKVTFNIKPTLPSPSPSTIVKEPRHSSLPTPLAYSSNNNNNTRRRISKSSNGRQNLLPIIGRKSSSVEDFDESEIEHVLPITNLTKYKSSDDLRDPNNFKVMNKSTALKLPIATQTQTPKVTLKIPVFNEMQPSCELSSKFYGNSNDDESCDNNNSVTENNNLDEFFQFVEKWRSNRIAGNKKIEDIFRNSSFQSRCSFKNSESKSSSLLSARLKAFKMSLDQVELVSKLLRASRNCNELLLKDCFKEILEHGISPKELNSTDKSGRTALSYICSTNLTNFLELFLHLPGIDVNKPDNEGNSALHFAAQAGQTEIVNMLLTKCKGINIDAKNNLGFTPLMKAALQGRTKTAKLLLFAGASPIETDPARAFRADQWARYCGRHQTAEMIETVARAKLLEKNSSNKWTHDVIPRSKTTSSMAPPPQQQIISNNNINNNNIIQQQQQTSHSGGFRSKFSGFRKVFPFSSFSMKDKHKDKDEKTRNGFVNVTDNNNSSKGAAGDDFHNGEIVNYLTAAALVVGGGPAQTNGSNKQIIKSLCRPLHVVPKLEVTYANNNTLIKKYENMPNIERPSSSPASTETNSGSEEKSTTTKKKANGIRKVFSERSKSLISSGGGKQKINTDAYF